MSKLRLPWSRTWPDKPADFVCHAPGVEGSVGRIHLTQRPRGEGNAWFWGLSGYIRERDMYLTQRGTADTKMEAAEAVEAAYFAVIEPQEPTSPP